MPVISGGTGNRIRARPPIYIVNVSNTNVIKTLLLLPLMAAAAIKTGPEIGTVIPGFSLPDQNGRQQTLASIAGPKGAMLVFYRSADW
jgi:hypothetical protein